MKHVLRVCITKNSKDINQSILLDEFDANNYSPEMKLNIKGADGGRLEFPSQMNNTFWMAVTEQFMYKEDEEDVLIKNKMLEVKKDGKYISKTLK